MRKWLSDEDCYLLRGKNINQIIAMLIILEKKNPNVEQLTEFIKMLKALKSYNEILDTFMIGTRAEDMSLRERNEDGLSLNQILSRFNIKLSEEDDDGKD